MRKITSKILANPQIKHTPKETSNEKNIEIDLRYFCFKSINYRKFTNFLSREEEYISMFNKLYKDTLPYLKNNTFEKLKVENKHCHTIKDKVEKVKDILMHYSSIGFEIMDLEGAEDTSFYQLCSVGSVRMIGYRVDNIFYLFFLDFHHLIYPSEKYNNYDYSSHRYPDSKIYLGSPEIKNYIFEECFDCELMK